MILNKILKKLFVKKDNLELIKQLKVSNKFARQTYTENLKKDVRYNNPKSLVPYGYNLYSEHEEDGMIREIFQRIGVTNKVFVEFGIGDGRENNTLALLFESWKGLWIDSSSSNVKIIKENLINTINDGYLKVINAFITKDNINNIISSNIIEHEIDLLSIDIDGNDFHILNSIKCINPRVIVIEYNAKFHPPLLWCMDYDEKHKRKGDDCQGASLKFLEINLENMGYHLVGCDISGCNAFFVRKDLTNDKFLKPYTTETHYEPPRYDLGFNWGLKAAFKTLESFNKFKKNQIHLMEE